VYLGHVIGGGELKIDLAKIEAILKWPTPTNVTKVRSFVGVANI
jgi:chemotaxis signal transduction protein